MTDNPVLRTLQLYVGKKCKVVFRDGGASSRVRVFMGTLQSFDGKFQVWDGHPDKQPHDRCQVVLNHDDINRIVITSGGA